MSTKNALICSKKLFLQEIVQITRNISTHVGKFEVLSPHVYPLQTSNNVWRTQMSEILIGSNPDNPQIVGIFKTEETAEEKGKQLPNPTGYHILCAIPEQDKEHSGSLIHKADTTLRMEEVLSTVFFVVEMGPDCYKDEKRFPTGPWCKKGDFILARPNTGTRLKIHGREFRIINDDSVEGTVDDPRGITRV